MQTLSKVHLFLQHQVVKINSVFHEVLCQKQVPTLLPISVSLGKTRLSTLAPPKAKFNSFLNCKKSEVTGNLSKIVTHLIVRD